MDLELASTDELAEELMKRFDNCCIVANTSMTESEDKRVMYWKCRSYAEIVGLLECIKQRLIRRWEKSARRTDG